MKKPNIFEKKVKKSEKKMHQLRFYALLNYIYNKVSVFLKIPPKKKEPQFKHL
jgi:hypothetical protein